VPSNAFGKAFKTTGTACRLPARCRDAPNTPATTQLTAKAPPLVVLVLNVDGDDDAATRADDVRAATASTGVGVEAKLSWQGLNAAARAPVAAGI